MAENDAESLPLPHRSSPGLPLFHSGPLVHPLLDTMISDAELSAVTNVMGVVVFVMAVSYHYMVADHAKGNE